MTNNNENKNKLRIAQIPMVSVCKTNFTTTNELASTVTKLVRSVTDDISYCRIEIDPKMGVTSYLVFADTPKTDSSKCKFVLPVQKVQTAKSTLDMFLSRQNQRANFLTLTDEAKESLEAFIPNLTFRGGRWVSNKDMRTKKIFWDRVSKEINEPGAFGEPRCFISVQFSLVEFFKEVYGSKSETGERYEYILTPIRPANNAINAQGQMVATNYAISYMQINKNELEKVFTELSPSPVNSQFRPW